MKTKNLIAVKIGSNVLTRPDGLPNLEVIGQLASQMAALRKQQVQLVLVSSGAVAAGRSILPQRKKLDTVAERQLLSSLGQVRLMQIYTELFKSHEQLCAQVLVTKQDFRDRNHYLNMKNCLVTLLDNGIIPVINENDVISITELMFTDNDELAGLVSSMLNVDVLYILTNVPGIYNKSPNAPDAELIAEFDPQLHAPEHIAGQEKSNFGRGGIITKCNTALKVARIGIPVVICSGYEPDVLLKLQQGQAIGTRFNAHRLTSPVKKWIANAQGHTKGEVVVNDGARDKMRTQRATSLLPVGIVSLSGDFKRGEVVRIVDESGAEIGLGMARYNHKKAKELIGQKNQKPLIHYDHLYLH